MPPTLEIVKTPLPLGPHALPVELFVTVPLIVRFAPVPVVTIPDEIDPAYVTGELTIRVPLLDSVPVAPAAVIRAIVTFKFSVTLNPFRFTVSLAPGVPQLPLPSAASFQIVSGVCPPGALSQFAEYRA